MAKKTKKNQIKKIKKVTSTSQKSVVKPAKSIACDCQDKRHRNPGLGLTLIFVGVIIMIVGVIYYFTPDEYTQTIDEALIFYNSDEMTDEELTGYVPTDFNLETGTAATNSVSN